MENEGALLETKRQVDPPSKFAYDAEKGFSRLEGSGAIYRKNDRYFQKFQTIIVTRPNNFKRVELFQCLYVFYILVYFT